MVVKCACTSREAEEQGDGASVCVKCFKPADTLAHYCPNCGGATGQSGSIVRMSSARQASQAGSIR